MWRGPLLRILPASSLPFQFPAMTCALFSSTAPQEFGVEQSTVAAILSKIIWFGTARYMCHGPCAPAYSHLCLTIIATNHRVQVDVKSEYNAMYSMHRDVPRQHCDNHGELHPGTCTLICTLKREREHTCLCLELCNLFCLHVIFCNNNCTGEISF